MISKSINPLIFILLLTVFLVTVLTPFLILSLLITILNPNIQNVLPLLPLLIYLGLFVYTIIFLTESFIILKIVFNPKKKEGVYSLFSMQPAVLYYIFNELFLRINEKLFSMLLIPSAIYSDVLFKIFGLKCGKNIMLNPIKDPYLTEIGDDSVIGQGVLILCHSIVRDNITLKRVKIGKNVTIGVNSIISPGVIIEDNVIIGANSFVKQNATLEKNSFYAGVPAKILEKKT